MPPKKKSPKKAAKPKKKSVNRSSKSGEFVTGKFAKKHPNTTERETID